jgi:crotonobetainyl-CoA:carnitine CoA-transferase CaiB-like acyl-CoA transferase
MEASGKAKAGPLEGIRVLDFSRVLAGPWCAMILGDLGAEVIKIESPEGDDLRHFGPPFKDGESAYFQFTNRNKKSIVVDLKTEEGQKIAFDLAMKSDVVIENLRRGAMEKYGLGYEQLRAGNPGLIYCAVSGYGRTGPAAERAGYDFLIQAESGLMSIIGDETTPPMKVGAAVTDMAAGQDAVTGVLAALFHRTKTGKGQMIDAALLDSAVPLLANQGAAYLMTGDKPKRLGNDHPSVVPYRPFETKDHPLALAIGADRQFRKFAAVMGRPDMADDPRFATNKARAENRAALYEIIEAIFLTRGRDDWLVDLHAAGLPAGAIRTVDQVLEAPEVHARSMVVEVDHAKIGPERIIGSPLKLSETPVAIRSAPPTLGQQTAEVLTDVLGWDADTAGDYAGRTTPE